MLLGGRFRIRRRIGAGAFGEVFEAEDSASGGVVALKRLARVDDGTLYRFKREFRAIAELRHENLVRMRELGVFDGDWYLVMDFVAGVDFLRWVRLAPADDVTRDLDAGAEVDLERLRRAFAQLVAGVSALHAAGMIHRDLKPANVLVESSGRVVILDFGLVADAAEPDRLRAGTPRYMAPELMAEGRASAASDWYAVGVMLQEALGRRPPDPELAELARRLVSTDPTKRRPGLEHEHPRAEPFVGREPELRALHAALANRELTIVHVRGDSGLGKTTLVKRFLEDVRRSDAIVLEGRCRPNESLPFNALDEMVDALARALEALPRLDLEAVLPRDARLLATSFPVLDRALAHAPARPAPTSPPERRRRAFAAMRELVTRLSDRRRVVIHLDDLQWRDADSAAMLEEILRGPDPPALLLVASYRAETGAVLDETAPHLLLDLAPFREDEARALATMLGPGERASAVATNAGGSPLLVQLLAQNGAGSLAAVLATLSASEMQALEVLAIASHALSTEIVTAAGAAQAREALERLCDERLARRSAQDRQAFIIVHDRVREAVLTILGERRRRIHLALAVALEAAGDTDVEVLAEHFHEGGERARAGRYAALAANRALDAFAFHRAASWLTIALEAGADDVARLEARLGDALTFAGRALDAAAAYLSAAKRVSDRREALELRRRAAQQLLFAGRFDRGKAEMRAVLAEVGLPMPEARLSAMTTLLAQQALLRVRGLSFTWRAEAEIDRDELLAVDICRSATIGLGLVDVVGSAAIQARHILRALAAGEPRRIGRALGFEVMTSAAGGCANRARTRELLERLDAVVADLDDDELRGVARAVRGGALYLEGDFAAVPEQMAIADPLLAQTPAEIMHYGQDSLRVVWLASLHWLGRWREAIERADRLVADAERRSNVYMTTYLQTGIHAIGWLALHGPAEAKRRTAAARAPWSSSESGFQVPDLLNAVGHAELALAAGDAKTAHALAAAAVVGARRSLIDRCQYFRASIRETLARATLAIGDVGAARRHATRLEREGLGWATACAALIRGGAAALAGEDPTALVASALAGFEAAGMTMHAACARGDLDALRAQGVRDPATIVRLLAPAIHG